MRYHKPHSNFKNNQQGQVRIVLALFGAVLLIVVLTVSNFVYKIAYEKGYDSSNKETKILTDGIEMNTEGVKSIQLENKVLKSETEAAKQERDISLNNLVEMRERVKKLQTSNAQLQQTIDIYGKNIMSRGGIPLQIIGAKIAPLPEGAYEYRFDILQLTKDGKVQELKPSIKLLTKTSFVSIPLEPSSYEIKGVARVRGRFVMPKGFTPSQMQLNLTAGSEELEQVYNWKLGKRTNNLPLSLAEIPDTDDSPITD